MSVQVRCPNPECGAVYEVREEHLGRTVECKRCQRRFVAETVAPSNTARPENAASPPPIPAAKPKAAKTLGRFQLCRRVGAGAFGSVFRAHDPVLDRDVAIKIAHPGVIETEADQTRFLREPKAAAQLRHPNLVPVYEAGHEADTYFIVSEFIEGKTLRDVLRDGTPPADRAARIVEDLAMALDYAHAQGIIHRDVKPANIMLDGRGSPVLMDFGLARSQKAEDQLTRDGALLGTPAYMSPEQAAGQHSRVGPAADQYSLGVVLYEMLCGQTPFAGFTTPATYNVLHLEPPAPRSVKAAIPKDLETICLKAIAKSPEDRYARCGELAEDLRRWREGELIHARRVPLWERAARWCRRNPAVASLSAVSAILLVAVALVATIGYVKIRSSLDKEAQAREQAEKDSQRAEDALARETAERNRAESSLYFSRIALARQKWYNSEADAAEELLDACPEELRNWEWGYLKRLCSATVRTFPHGSTGVAYSPDGKKLASASDSDEEVKVWDAATGQQLLTLPGHDQVAFSPNGERIAAIADENLVKVWDATTGQEIHALRGHTDRVFSLAFSPDGKRIATASDDNTVKLWDSGTGKETLTFRGHMSNRQPDILGPPRDLVGNVAFSPDSLCVASCGSNDLVKIWQAETGEELMTIPVKGGAGWVAFSPDGTKIATTAAGHIVKLWDTATGEELATCSGHTLGVSCVVFSPDGKLLATSSFDKTARVWGVADGRELFVYRGHPEMVSRLSFAPDGRRIASTAYDGTVKIWDCSKTQEAYGLTGGLFAFSPDGKRVATEDCFSEKINILNMSTGEALASKTVPRKLGMGPIVSAIAFAPDGKQIAFAPVDGGGVILCDAATGKETFAFRDHKEPVSALAFSPDGARIVSASGSPKKPAAGEEGSASQQASEESAINVWSAAKGEVAFALQGHHAKVHDLAFSPDGRLIASADLDGKAKLWDAATGQSLRDFQAHITSPLAFSTDSKRIALVTPDYCLKLYDTTTGSEVLALRKQNTFIKGVAFSSDGKRLAYSTQGAVSLWDAERGQEAITFRVPLSSASLENGRIAFSPDGTRLALSASPALLVWETQAARQENGEIAGAASFPPLTMPSQEFLIQGVKPVVDAGIDNEMGNSAAPPAEEQNTQPSISPQPSASQPDSTADANTPDSGNLDWATTCLPEDINAIISIKIDKLRGGVLYPLVEKQFGQEALSGNFAFLMQLQELPPEFSQLVVGLLPDGKAVGLLRTAGAFDLAQFNAMGGNGKPSVTRTYAGVKYRNCENGWIAEVRPRTFCMAFDESELKSAIDRFPKDGRGGLSSALGQALKSAHGDYVLAFAIDPSSASPQAAAFASLPAAEWLAIGLQDEFPCRVRAELGFSTASKAAEVKQQFDTLLQLLEVQVSAAPADQQKQLKDLMSPIRAINVRVAGKTLQFSATWTKAQVESLLRQASDPSVLGAGAGAGAGEAPASGATRRPAAKKPGSRPKGKR